MNLFALLGAFAAAPISVPVAAELQGEAVAYLADGSGYITASEGLKQSISAALCQ